MLLEGNKKKTMLEREKSHPKIVDLVLKMQVTLCSN